MAKITPKWKTCKSGAQSWVWFVDDNATSPKCLKRMTFFKKNNKLTLRVRVVFKAGGSTVVKDVNILTFFLRKQKTLEVYLRRNIGPYSPKKVIFDNISNTFSKKIDAMFNFLKIESPTLERMFSVKHASETTRLTWIYSRVEEALRSMLKDNGFDFECPHDYRYDQRLAGGILEFRCPIIKTLREDWKKRFNSVTLPEVLERISSPDASIKRTAFNIQLKNVYIPPVVMRILSNCRDIKDLTNKFMGNKGKVSTKIISESIFTFEYHVLDSDEYKLYCLTNKILSGSAVASVESVYKRKDTALLVEARFNTNLLLSALILKKVLSVDHLNQMFRSYNFHSFSRGINSIVECAGENYLYEPRDVSYKSVVDKSPSAAKQWRASVKFKRKTEKIVKDIVEFLRLIGDSKKIYNLFEKDYLYTSVTLFDTYIQWYQSNNKIVLPSKPKSVVDLHDYVSDEFRKLSIKDFDLGLMERESVKKLDQLEYCDVETRRHFKLEIAKTNHQLIQWGKKMHNCIGSYGRRVVDSKGHLVLLAVYVDGTMKYNVEIKNQLLQQFHASFNNSPDQDDLEAFKKVVPIRHYGPEYALTQDHRVDAVNYAVAGNRLMVNYERQIPAAVDYVDLQLAIDDITEG